MDTHLHPSNPSHPSPPNLPPLTFSSPRSVFPKLKTRTTEPISHPAPNSKLEPPNPDLTPLPSSLSSLNGLDHTQIRQSVDLVYTVPSFDTANAFTASLCALTDSTQWRSESNQIFKLNAVEIQRHFSWPRCGVEEVVVDEEVEGL
ncbi:hypothetical protein EV1_045546 [Malus domestica]